MKIVLVLVVLGLAGSGCTAVNRRHLARLELGAAVAATACDWGQTRAEASRGWMRPDGQGGWIGRSEQNLLLGSKPSVGAVDAYMATSIAAIIASHYLLPESWQPYVYGGVIAIEAHSLAINFGVTPGLCGLQRGTTTVNSR